MVPTRQGKYLVPIINKLKLEVIMEIGVWKGHTARFILRGCPNIKEYWVTDPWTKLPKSYMGKMTNVSQEDWNKMYLRLCQDLYYFKALKVLRLHSIDAAKIFKKPHFDLVFIDAQHTYEAVKNDINIWKNLVKKGKYLSGHDYGMRKHPGVKTAVDEIFGKENITVERNSAVWMVRI